jgi:hypothetical protein
MKNKKNFGLIITIVVMISTAILGGCGGKDNQSNKGKSQKENPDALEMNHQDSLIAMVKNLQIDSAQINIYGNSCFYAGDILIVDFGFAVEIGRTGKKSDLLGGSGMDSMKVIQKLLHAKCKTIESLSHAQERRIRSVMKPKNMEDLSVRFFNEIFEGDTNKVIYGCTCCKKWRFEFRVYEDIPFWQVGGVTIHAYDIHGEEVQDLADGNPEANLNFKKDMVRLVKAEIKRRRNRSE